MADTTTRKGSPGNPTRQILIIGCGILNKRYMSRQALAALGSAELFIGERRLLRKMADLLGDGRIEEASSYAKIRKIIINAPESRIAVLVEGDAGMGPLEESSLALMDLRPVIIPGISLISYAAARTGVPYADAQILDLRKKRVSLIPALETNRIVFACGNDRMNDLFHTMISAGLTKVGVYALENPAEESERLFRGTIHEAAGRSFSANTIFAFIRKGRPTRGRFGIRDDVFKNSSSEAKREIRAAVLSYLEPAEHDILYCIGSGFGEVAAEAALLARSGMVYAIEQDLEKAAVSEENLAALGIGNVSVINGIVPGALSHLPPPDAAYIACGGDIMKDLLQILVSRNPDVRIAAETKDMNNALRISALMEGMSFRTEEKMISISDIVNEGEKRKVVPAQPVFLICGVRRSGILHG